MTSHSRKRPNIKAILILLVGIAVVGTSVHFAHRFQVSRNAHVLLEEAKRAEADGKLGDSSDLYEQYMYFQPQDNEAYGDYSLLVIKAAKSKKNLVRAYGILEEALRRDDSRKDVRRELAKLAVAMGEYKSARDHIKTLQTGNQNDGELWKLLAAMEIRQGKNYRDAADALQKALKANPSDLPLAQELAMLLRTQLEDREGADVVMSGLLEAKKGDIATRIKVAEYFQNFGKLEKAESILDASKTENADAILLAGQIVREQSRLALRAENKLDSSEKSKKAREILNRGAKLFARDTRFSQELAQLDFADGDIRAATERVQTIVDSVPEDPKEIFDRANLLIEVKKFDDVEKMAAALEKKSKVAWAADWLRGIVLMKREAWGEAKTKFEICLKGTPPAAAVLETHLRLAECQGRMGNVDSQIAECRAALAIELTNQRAIQMLAASLLAGGRREEAITQYRLLIDRDPGTRVELAKLLMARTFRLPPADRQWTEINSLLEKSPASRSAEVRLLQAEVLLARDKADEAKKIVTAERDRDPKQLAPWMHLIAMAERSGAKNILEIVDEAEKATGPKAEWILVRARSLSRNPVAETTAQLKALEANLEKVSEAEKDSVALGLGDSYLACGDAGSAERLWTELAARRKSSIPIRTRLFTLYAQAAKDESARKVLNEIAILEGPEGALAPFGEAALYARQVRQGNKEAIFSARDSLAKAAAKRPDWTQVILLDAELLQLEGKKAEALKRFQTIIDRDDSTVAVVRQVAQLLSELGRGAEADAVLQKIPKETLAAAGLTKASVQLTLLNATGVGAEKTRKQALEEARRTVLAGKGKYADHLWLGRMAMLAGEPVEGLMAFRKARDLDPTAPDAWLAIVTALASSDPKNAQAELDAARSRVAPDRATMLMAAGYEALGKTKEAAEQYKKLAIEKPDDLSNKRNLTAFYLRVGAWKDAEPMLNQILTNEVKTTEEMAIWARRAMALILSTKGGFKNFQKANELLDENDKLREPLSEDRWARAIVSAPQPGLRQKAIDLLQDLATPANAPPDFKFLLARLYDANNLWTDAKQTLTSLIASNPKNVSYLSYYTRALLRQKDLDTADPLVKKLQELEPQSFEPIELRARILKERNRLADAVKLLNEHALAKPTDIVAVAATLETIEAIEESEKAFRRYVETAKDPKAVLVLVRHLAAHKKLDEALNLLNDAWKTCPPEAVAAMAVNAVRLGQANSEQTKRVENWIKEAIEKSPKSIGLLVLQAQLFETVDRHQEAITQYQKIIERDPKNVIALNNLAFVLALRDENTDEALRLINRAMELIGPHPELLDTRSVIHLKAKQANLAAEDASQAIDSDPSPTKYFHLAQAKLLANDKTAAAKALRGIALKESDVHTLERSELLKVRKAISIP